MGILYQDLAVPWYYANIAHTSLLWLADPVAHFLSLVRILPLAPAGSTLGFIFSAFLCVGRRVAVTLCAQIGLCCPHCRLSTAAPAFFAQLPICTLLTS